MTVLDPDPTIFGTGRIDPTAVAPGDVGEYQRAVLWINNRAARLAFGGRLRAALVGDPIAAYNVRAAFQPLIDWRNDQMVPPGEETEYDDPPSNWSGNDA